jgi:hypothetical protein
MDSTITIPLCEHIKDDGEPCRGAAIRGRHFCYFHLRHHRPGPLPGQKHYRAPLLDSHAGLKLQLNHIIQGLSDGTINVKAAELMIRAIRVGAKFVNNTDVVDRRVGCTDLPASMLSYLDGNYEEPPATPTPEPLPHDLPTPSPAPPPAPLSRPSDAPAPPPQPRPIPSTTKPPSKPPQPFPRDITPEQFFELSESNPELFTTPELDRQIRNLVKQKR